MLKVYGGSDDLIEIEGDVEEEFTYLDDDEAADLLAFSDGTILKIYYNGVWRIGPVLKGKQFESIEQCSEDDEDNYSDVATFKGTIDWVVHGNEWGRK